MHISPDLTESTKGLRAVVEFFFGSLSALGIEKLVLLYARQWVRGLGSYEDFVTGVALDQKVLETLVPLKEERFREERNGQVAFSPTFSCFFGTAYPNDDIKKAAAQADLDSFWQNGGGDRVLYIKEVSISESNYELEPKEEKEILRALLGLEDLE